MGVPGSRDARQFYRCSDRRIVEARILRKADQTTGAVYLAGYSVECILKALILETLASHSRDKMLKLFRGHLAHNFEWLREQYLLNGGSRFPANINRAFMLVSDWSTELRYEPKSIKPEEADRFLDAADEIIRWADGRM
ncbi:MAG: HEPN domain-containing protein [Isosphaeraceae bacterium]